MKLLFVEPGEELSLQRHKNRSEFWRVVGGEGEITIGDEIKKAKKGDEFFIARNVKHRAKAGEKTLEILISKCNLFLSNIVRLTPEQGNDIMSGTSKNLEAVCF